MPSYASLSATSRTSVPGECGEAALAVQPENKSRERSVAQGVSASWIAGVRPAASECLFAATNGCEQVRYSIPETSPYKTFYQRMGKTRGSQKTL